VQNKDVHVFTCGRDTATDRGRRTVIDKWDYRTVLDITHFLSRHYPATQVTIEDPVSKLRRSDLKNPADGADRLATLHALLRNKNCIVVGSPDVSDFAEIVLSKAHDIPQYQAERRKRSGYVLVKDSAGEGVPSSSHYWTREGDEPAGVRRLGDGEKWFPAEFDEKTGRGTMHGILAVVRNPFFDAVDDRPAPRVVLLSGFSGVATNAIAKFLTDDRYLDAFGQFDREYVDVERNIEVLIGVSYLDDPRSGGGDVRTIVDVWFEGMTVVSSFR
jgi:hypothetical protein